MTYYFHAIAKKSPQNNGRKTKTDNRKSYNNCKEKAKYFLFLEQTTNRFNS